MLNKIGNKSGPLFSCRDFYGTKWDIDCLFFFFFFFFFFFCLLAFSRATPVAYGGFKARGLIGAIADGLCQSHSNARSEPHLLPTPQLMVTLDP